MGKEQKNVSLQAEIEVVTSLLDDPSSVIHPFTILPLSGQLLLFLTLFQRKPSKTLTLFGLGSLSILLGFMFVIGLPALNYRILFSTFPFIITGILVLRSQGKIKQK